MINYNIKREDAIFVAVDFQEKLMPAMKSADDVEEAAEKLIKGLRILEVPVIFTQQYTKGLGMTVEPLRKACGEKDEAFEYIEKTTFSAVKEPAFVSALQRSGKKTVIIGGVEAHICVQQTVLDLLENGYHVFVAVDCIGSRSNTDKKYSQRRMSEAGAVGTTFESILFELCGGAKDPSFKQISALVK